MPKSCGVERPDRFQETEAPMVISEMYPNQGADRLISSRKRRVVGIQSRVRHSESEIELRACDRVDSEVEWNRRGVCLTAT